MTCTWEGCTANATKPQTSNDGSHWANLCDAHAEIVDGMFDLGPAAIMSTWIRAQGGAKAAAARMLK